MRKHKINTTELKASLRSYAEDIALIASRPASSPLGKNLSAFVREATMNVTLPLVYGIKYNFTWTVTTASEVLNWKMQKSELALRILAERIVSGNDVATGMVLDHVVPVKKLTEQIRSAKSVEEIEAIILSANFQVLEEVENKRKGSK